MKNGQAAIRKRLEHLAYQRSRPYCETCESNPELEVCEKCFTPVCVRELPGVGTGPLSWVIREFLNENAFDSEAMFNQLLDGHKELFIFGRIGVTPSMMLRAAFPKCYRMLLAEFKKTMMKRGRIMKISSELYWTDDVSDWLDENDIQ